MSAWDVGIIGGGPAGSALAGYLARAGAKVLVLERARFPRPHVGESLVPAANRVLADLELLPKMDALGFVRKHGATWSRAGSRARPHRMDFAESVSVRFDEREQPGVPEGHTWHVDRARFDEMLLERAVALGAEVRQGARVRRVELGEQPALVTDRGERLPVRFLADASGRGRVIGRQLGLEQADPDLDQYALHSWFSGYDRLGPNRDDIVIRFLDERGTWMWQIPISAEVTSVGVVAPKRRLAEAAGDPERLFAALTSADPEVGARLSAAARVRPLSAEADYSYTMRRFSGPRFVLVGDAARFVDPIFSSGVSIALSSAHLASRDLLAALDQGGAPRHGAGPFETFESTMRRGVANWYAFIRLYYRLDVLFTWFVSQPVYRHPMLKLLQGDVYDEDEPEVLRLMRDKLAEVERSPGHMWHPLLR